MSLENPVVIMPFVYTLPIGLWRWCNLKEVCAMIPNMARLVELDFAPSPEDLVSRFAVMAKRNDPLEARIQAKEPGPRPKHLRYSPDGHSFDATPVPDTFNPLKEVFRLDMPSPYPETLFVPEGWVIDTLKAIQMGAVAVQGFLDDGKDVLVGMPPDPGKPVILIKAPKSGTLLVHTG